MMISQLTCSHWYHDDIDAVKVTLQSSKEHLLSLIYLSMIYIYIYIYVDYIYLWWCLIVCIYISPIQYLNWLKINIAILKNLYLLSSSWKIFECITF
jgi:uncharacterized membrane protein YqjE